VVNIITGVNSTNVFDAASGFGGYRESGFAREGGKEGTRDWFDDRQAQGREYLRRATQIKNIWVPYGE